MSRSQIGRVAAALAVALTVAAVSAAGPASAAHVARLDVRPVEVPPGGEVTIAGPPGWAPSPVTIHWNSIDGEVLGTFTTTTGGNASFGPGTVTIPNVAPGVYELVGTQDVPDNQPQVRGVPARARIVVVAPGGVAPAASTGNAPIRELESLDEGDSASTLALIGVGLGVFAVTLGIGVVAASAVRRRPTAASASAKVVSP